MLEVRDHYGQDGILSGTFGKEASHMVTACVAAAHSTRLETTASVYLAPPCRKAFNQARTCSPLLNRS